MKRIFIKKILPGLISKIFIRGIVFKKNAIKLVIHVFASFFKGEFKSPDFSPQYPATLHINIARNYRGKSVGKSLIERFEKLLQEKKVNGVHFGTISEKASLFFNKLGFNVLFKSSQSYLTYYTGEKVSYYVCGKMY